MLTKCYPLSALQVFQNRKTWGVEDEKIGLKKERRMDGEDRLVLRAAEGDKEAYRELVEHYQHSLASFVFSILKNRDDAQDVVQEVFVKAYLSLSEFEHRSSFKTWLFRIASNMAIDYRRKLMRRGGEHEELSEVHGREEEKFSQSTSTPTMPESALLRKEQAKHIENALESISEDHRQIIVLREVEGLSYEEIAEVTGISKGTVMSRLFYARKRLQEMLKEFAPFRSVSSAQGERATGASSEDTLQQNKKQVRGN